MKNLREDSLLIGDYKVFQDPDAYCFTSDSVRLSKFAHCKNSVVRRLWDSGFA